MKKEKRFLTAEEAISILPDGEYVHTTYQTGFVFVGADWDREDIIDKIQNSEKREITGPNARAMGHGAGALSAGREIPERYSVRRNGHETAGRIGGEGMSVLIPGMKMPKDLPIAILIWPDGKVCPAGLYKTEEWSDKKAIEIKTQHGRLIDADDFEQKIIEMLDAVPGAIEHWVMLFAAELAKNSPAIIEAEGGGEDG